LNLGLAHIWVGWIKNQFTFFLFLARVAVWAMCTAFGFFWYLFFPKEKYFANRFWLFSLDEVD